MLERLAGEPFDVIVVGGGASGLGIAVDASSRGYRTLLLECGFSDVVTHPSLRGEVDEAQRGLVVLVARRGAANVTG